MRIWTIAGVTAALIFSVASAAVAARCPCWTVKDLTKLVKADGQELSTCAQTANRTADTFDFVSTVAYQNDDTAENFTATVAFSRAGQVSVGTCDLTGTAGVVSKSIEEKTARNCGRGLARVCKVMAKDIF